MKAIVLVGLAVVISSCGVKGKPLPPLTAPQIGRGKPTFSKTEKVSLDELNRKKDSEYEKQDDRREEPK